MSAELRICVPDEVADWIRRHGDESAAVTEAVRARIRADQAAELLRAAGLTPGVPIAWPEHLPAAAMRRPAEPPILLAEGRRTLAGRPAAAAGS